MIGIVDLGSGNLASIERVIADKSGSSMIVSEPIDIERASKLIIPGVGRFDVAMSTIRDRGYREALDTAVLERRVPILGICVGMQILATKSQEGESPGLNWISGKCERFPDDPDLKVPHIGWNAVEAIRNSALSVDMEPESKFYFLHSYYLEPCDSADVVMSARYGDVQFAAMVQRDNIFGVQFHPEKSHGAGRRMIEKFVRM